MNINNLISYGIYFALLNLIFNPYIYISLVLIFFIIFLAIKFSLKNFLLINFYIFPFTFLIRNQDHSNIILTLIPDFFMIFSALFFFFYKKIIISNKYLLSLLIFYTLITIIIKIYHIGDYLFLPILLRQHFIPLIFLITFIFASQKNNILPIEAIKISVISYGIVALIAILNYFELINIKTFHEAKIDERIIFDISLPRADIFLGGAIGSSAAILFTLGLVAIFLKEKKYNKLNLFLSIPLFLASCLNLSYSIIVPIIYASFIFITIKKTLVQIIKILILFVFSYFFITKNLLNQISISEYIQNNFLEAYIYYISHTNFFNILLGVGPIITSKGYEFIPDVYYIIDAGIFRVLIETGILNFILFVYILYILLKKLIFLDNNYNRNYNKIFLIILLVIISLPHGNITSTPPFNLLFITVITWITIKSDIKKI
jgi:hypothetical protein